MISKPITILYFSWLRERTGCAHEEIALPDRVETVAGLMDYLASRNARYAEAFQDRAILRCAINQELAQLSSPVQAGDEMAFFPPVTGG